MIVVNWFTKHPHTKNTYQPSCNLFLYLAVVVIAVVAHLTPLSLSLSLHLKNFFSPASVAEEFIKLVLYSLLLTLTYKYFCPFYYFYDNFNLTFLTQNYTTHLRLSHQFYHHHHHPPTANSTAHTNTLHIMEKINQSTHPLLLLPFHIMTYRKGILFFFHFK